MADMFPDQAVDDAEGVESLGRMRRRGVEVDGREDELGDSCSGRGRPRMSMQSTRSGREDRVCLSLLQQKLTSAQSFLCGSRAESYLVQVSQRKQVDDVGIVFDCRVPNRTPAPLQQRGVVRGDRIGQEGATQEQRSAAALGTAEGMERQWGLCETRALENLHIWRVEESGQSTILVVKLPVCSCQSTVEVVAARCVRGRFDVFERRLERLDSRLDIAERDLRQAAAHATLSEE